MAENNSRDHQVEQGQEAMRSAAALLGQEELVEEWKSMGTLLIALMTVKGRCASIHRSVHVLAHQGMAHGEWQKAAEPLVDEGVENTSTEMALMGQHHKHDPQS